MKTLTLTLGLLLSSCVTPAVVDSNPYVHVEIPLTTKIIRDSEPSFDNNVQNSGILDFEVGKGWLITESALLRYNSLIKKYGSDFDVPIKFNFGVSTTNDDPPKIYLTQEAMIKFAQMNQTNKTK